jgi:hypothetical protein
LQSQKGKNHQEKKSQLFDTKPPHINRENSVIKFIQYRRFFL